MKFLTNFLIFFILTSCQFQNIEEITEYVEDKKINIKKEVESKEDQSKEDQSKEDQLKEDQLKGNIFYLVGDPYFIQGVEHIPQENYQYAQSGLATFYGKELHNIKTYNNDLNKVTELLGRHKTLPLPSIVKVTNLENGLSLILKINDRHDDNSSIIQVSRKVAQLLRFYKKRITKVKVEILVDPSKQMKVVTESMDDPNFNDTINSAPTEDVEIFDLNELPEKKDNIMTNKSQPIELGFEEVSNQNLYLKIYGFKTYEEIKQTINILEIQFNTTIQKELNSYSVLIGPFDNEDVNNLVSSFIAKGYKKTEIIIE